MTDQPAAEDQPVPYTLTPAGLAYLADHPDIAADSELDAPHGTGCACEMCPDYDGPVRNQQAEAEAEQEIEL